MWEVGAHAWWCVENRIWGVLGCRKECGVSQSRSGVLKRGLACQKEGSGVLKRRSWELKRGLGCQKGGPGVSKTRPGCQKAGSGCRKRLLGSS